MIDRRRLLALLSVAPGLAACDPALPPSTGGTDVAPGPFGRGVLSLNASDAYDATSASLVGLDGTVLSASFLTSGLSGDVAAPSSRLPGDEVVLLDRWYSIVNWVDVRTAEVRAQLHADGDELARNPWDYLPISPDKAYVTRYDPWPGNADHGDVAIVSPAEADVLTPIDRRIEIGPALGLPPGHVTHPARGVVAGDRAYLVTVNATADYEYSDSHLVVIDSLTDQVEQAQELTGMHDCTAIALSPDREELAIACSGDLQANGQLAQEHSGLVVLSRATLEEKRRFTAPELGGGVLGFSLSYASQRQVLVLLSGNLSAGVDDAAVLVNLDTGEPRAVHTAAPFAIGQVLCPARIDGLGGDAASPPACFVTDAEKGLILRYPALGGSLGEAAAVRVDSAVGLPPRYLGLF